MILVESEEGGCFCSVFSPIVDEAEEESLFDEIASSAFVGFIMMIVNAEDEDSSLTVPRSR